MVVVLVRRRRLQLAVGFTETAGTEIVLPRLCTLLSQQRRARAASLRASIAFDVFLLGGLVEDFEGRVLRDEEIAPRAIAAHIQSSLLTFYFQIFLGTAAVSRFDQVLSRFENQSVLVRLTERQSAAADEATFDGSLVHGCVFLLAQLRLPLRNQVMLFTFVQLIDHVHYRR